MHDLNCPLTEQQFAQLKAVLDHMQTCSDVALYITAGENVHAC